MNNRFSTVFPSQTSCLKKWKKNLASARDWKFYMKKSASKERRKSICVFLWWSFFGSGLIAIFNLKTVIPSYFHKYACVQYIGARMWDGKAHTEAQEKLNRIRMNPKFVDGFSRNRKKNEKGWREECCFCKWKDARIKHKLNKQRNWLSVEGKRNNCILLKRKNAKVLVGIINDKIESIQCCKALFCGFGEEKKTTTK